MTSWKDYQEKIQHESKVLQAAAVHVENLTVRTDEIRATLDSVLDDMRAASEKLCGGIDKLDEIFGNRPVTYKEKDRVLNRKQQSHKTGKANLDKFRAYIGSKKEVNTRDVPKEIKPSPVVMRLSLETAGFEQKGRSLWVKT